MTRKPATDVAGNAFYASVLEPNSAGIEGMEIVKLIGCAGCAILLDYIYKLQVQLGFSIALRKRLPLGYSLLPLTKLALMANVVLSVFFGGIFDHQTLGPWSYWVIGSTAVYAMYALTLYRRQMMEP